MRNPLRGSAADLLPLLHAEEDHYVTTDGRVGRALACTGLNARIQSQEEADRTAARFAQALGVLRRYRGVSDGSCHQPQSSVVSVRGALV